MVKNIHISLTVLPFPFYMTKDFGHLTLSPYILILTHGRKKPQENLEGKDEIARNE